MTSFESILFVLSFPEVKLSFILLVLYFARDMVLHNNLTFEVVRIRLFRWGLLFVLLFFILNAIEYKSPIVIHTVDYAIHFLVLGVMPFSILLAYLYIQFQNYLVKRKRNKLEETHQEKIKND